MAKMNKTRYTIVGVDLMRAEVGATASSLANAASLSRGVVADILSGVKKPKTSCERVINGLRKLNHPTASYAAIVEHVDDEAIE